MELTNLWTTVSPRLKQYFATNPNSVPLISEFTGAKGSTVVDWFLAKHPAMGENLIRLWHFLAAVGYESPELAKIPEFNRFLSTLFAYGVIDLSETLQICGVTNSQAGLRALRGQSPMHPMYTVDELHELYDDRLNKAMADLRAKLKLQPKGTGPPKAIEPVAPKPKTEVAITPVLAGGMDSSMTLAMLLGAVAPLVRRFVSDDCTPAERSRLRSQLGEELLFELSNNMNALCGERARTQRR